ncbi:MAG: PD-(D/E)XK nuclease family protein [Patescibacteria group bacterium]
MDKKEFRLSPSSLNLFLECPRCFWLQINENIHRPRGAYPSLPSGMDNVIKVYFDRYRAKGKLPPEIEGEVRGKLIADPELLKKWRNWKTGLEYKDNGIGVTLFGALDDCLVHSTSSGQEEYFPLDYKTRGSAPREGDSEKYYGNQLDCYALLLEENNYPVGEFGYLIYYYPKEVKEKGNVIFEVELIKLKIDPERARRTIQEAVKLLHSPIPPHHSECEYCIWGRNNGD